MSEGFRAARVRFWEGSRGKQTPVALSLDGREQMLTLLREELVQNVDGGRPHRRYLVALEDGGLFWLRPGRFGWEAKTASRGN